MLKHALATTFVLGFLAPLAQADLIEGDPIDIVGTFDGEIVWGSPFEGTHPFGGFTGYVETVFFQFPIFVQSFELPPPPGKKFAGQIDIIYDVSYLNAFHLEEIDISGIKEPGGSNFINTVEVLGPLANFSNVSTDGFNIHFITESFDITQHGAGVVSIVWTQVPAPSALALLGLAGLCGTRRRR